MSASSLPLPQGKSVSLKQFVSRHINEIGLLVVIAILYLVFSLNAPGFISLNNQMNVLRDAATIGIAAWARWADGGFCFSVPGVFAAI